MQATHVLEVTRRERTGSRYAARERAAGKLPAVLYGQGKDPVALSLQAKEAMKFFGSGEKVFTIELRGEGKSQTVMLKDLQFGYLGDNVVHVDLVRVDLDQEVEAQVPLDLVGDAKGLKKAGAFLNQPVTAIAVKCKVSSLPDEIRVDISELDVDHPLHASELTLPSGVELVDDPETVIATILTREEGEDVEGTEAEGIAGADAAPERVGEKKDDGEGSGD